MTTCADCGLEFRPADPAETLCPRCAATALALQLVGGRRKRRKTPPR